MLLFFIFFTKSSIENPEYPIVYIVPFILLLFNRNLLRNMISLKDSDVPNEGWCLAFSENAFLKRTQISTENY